MQGRTDKYNYYMLFQCIRLYVDNSRVDKWCALVWYHVSPVVWLQVTILCLCLSYFPGSLALNFSCFLKLISISLTGMLVREQISTTPKNRMTLISDPKNRMPQNSNKKNRMSQDGMFVKVWINMKSYYDFMFSSTVCSSFKGFNCVIQKLEDPEK